MRRFTVRRPLTVAIVISVISLTTACYPLEGTDSGAEPIERSSDDETTTGDDATTGSRIDVEVLVEGAPPGWVLGLRGAIPAGWFIVGDDGVTMMHGTARDGHRLQLVREVTPNGPITPVADNPGVFIGVDDPADGVVRARVEFISEREPVVQQPLTQAEFAAAVQGVAAPPTTLP